MRNISHAYLASLLRCHPISLPPGGDLSVSCLSTHPSSQSRDAAGRHVRENFTSAIRKEKQGTTEQRPERRKFDGCLVGCLSSCLAGYLGCVACPVVHHLACQALRLSGRRPRDTVRYYTVVTPIRPRKRRQDKAPRARGSRRDLSPRRLADRKKREGS
jgi:hypothetical protein